MPKVRNRAAIGRHESFSAISAGGLQGAIESILRDYGDVIFQATENGLDAAAYALSAELKGETPVGKTKTLSKKWKVMGLNGKYKLKRYVGNETVVTDKIGNKISLVNIFQYSTVRGDPFVQETVENSVNKMAAAIVAEIKKEA